MPKKFEVTGKVKDLLEEMRRYREYWQDYFERGIESVRYVGGEQWSDADRIKFQKENRPVITINVLRSLVNQITGMRVAERLMPRVRPEREGTVEKANIYNKLLYFILKRQNYKSINYQVQQDQVVCGMGSWEIFIDDEDVRPELALRRTDWNEVMYDYLAEDIFYRDSRKIFRAKFLAPETVKEVYGIDFPKDFTHDWTDTDAAQTLDRFDDFVDDSGNILVIEVHEMRRKKEFQVTDGETFRRSDTSVDPEILQAIFGERAEQIETIKKEHWISTLIPAYDQGNPIQEEKAGLQLGTYPLVPVICYKVGDKIAGVVEDAKGEQDRINKSYSQMIEVLGYSAKNVYFTKTGSVDDDEFEKNISRPGGHINYDGDKPPTQANTAQLPMGYADLARMADANLVKITGVRPALEGRSEFAGESGVKQAIKLQQAKQQLSIIDKRFIDAFSYVCGLLLKGIPQVYTYQFTFQILEGNDQIQDVQINFPTLNGILNDMSSDNGEYDISIDQVGETGSFRQAMNDELSSMMSTMGPEFAGLLMPLWIRGQDIENKEEIAQRIELLTGQAMQLERAKTALAMIQAQQGVNAAQQAQGAKQQEQNAKMMINAHKERRATNESAAKIRSMQVNDEIAQSDSDMQNLEKMAQILQGARQ